jgi:hypothetical protein
VNFMDKQNYSPNPTSHILILTVDCFKKNKGGINNYDRTYSISEELPEISEKIKSVRQKIFFRLKNYQIHWFGDNEELPLNENLVNGEDFGGSELTGLYLRAIQRYNGDFFLALGDEGKEKILTTDHHFLIISACYGILKPIEYIQNYACQFGDNNSAYYEWSKQKDITKILNQYVKKFNIKRIFDFTECDVKAYQRVINWETICKDNPELSVLHGHSWATGDRPLHFFGEYTKNFLLDSSEKALLAVRSNSKIGDIIFYEKLESNLLPIAPKINPIDMIIDKDENAFVEFKTSAFGDITSDKLTYSVNNIEVFGRSRSCWKIAKSICGFLNSDGGNIFIGIDERKDYSLDHKYLGVESEFNKLDGLNYSKNFEGYGRLITHGIIEIFFPDIRPIYKNYLSIEPFEYQHHIFCWIKVKRSNKPVFVMNYKYYKEGQRCFYIRNDFEFQRLEISDAIQYVLEHFCPK